MAPNLASLVSSARLNNASASLALSETTLPLALLDVPRSPKQRPTAHTSPLLDCGWAAKPCAPGQLHLTQTRGDFGSGGAPVAVTTLTFPFIYLVIGSPSVHDTSVKENPVPGRYDDFYRGRPVKAVFRKILVTPIDRV